MQEVARFDPMSVSSQQRQICIERATIKSFKLARGSVYHISSPVSIQERQQITFKRQIQFIASNGRAILILASKVFTLNSWSVSGSLADAWCLSSFETNF